MRLDSTGSELMLGENVAWCTGCPHLRPRMLGHSRNRLPIVAKPRGQDFKLAPIQLWIRYLRTTSPNFINLLKQFSELNSSLRAIFKLEMLTFIDVNQRYPADPTDQLRTGYFDFRFRGVRRPFRETYFCTWAHFRPLLRTVWGKMAQAAGKDAGPTVKIQYPM
jgi:hypothetical protein